MEGNRDDVNCIGVYSMALSIYAKDSLEINTNVDILKVNIHYFMFQSKSHLFNKTKEIFSLRRHATLGPHSSPFQWFQPINLTSSDFCSAQ